MRNLIQFKKGFVCLPNNNCDNKKLVLSVNSELMQFGFCLDKEAIDSLSKSNSFNIEVFKNQIIDYLIDMTGSKHIYKPFWPGFPKQVMDMEESELWYNQILHYISNGEFTPSDLTKKRKKAFENTKPTIIKLGTDSDFLKIFTDLLSINQSLTDSDLDIITWFISSGQKLNFPNQIPFKETLILTMVDLIKSSRLEELNIPKLTTTDVLRIAVGLSEGNISLPNIPDKMVRENYWTTKLIENPLRESFRFKKFNRSERRLILSFLESTNCDSSEMMVYSNRWVRLGEILHPGEYKKQFPKSFKAFDSIRNKKAKTFESIVESKFKESFESGIEELAKRPGLFFRRLDSLVRKNPDRLDIIHDTIKKSGHLTSNKVLFEFYNYFLKRDVDQSSRTIMIKGKRKKINLPILPTLDKSIVSKISNSIYDTIGSKFVSLPNMGNTWIDPMLKKIPLPTNMRSLNETLRPVIRGQRIAFSNPEAKVIRPFVHWYDEQGDQDLDLTALFLKENGDTALIGWNGTHNEDFGCYSGDVRNRVGACAEYIDIDIKKSIKLDYRYVLITVTNYNGGSLESVKDCVFGTMEREKPKRGDIFFKPSLSNTSRLTSESKNTLVSILDLQEMNYIVADVDFGGIPVSSCNGELHDLIDDLTKDPNFSVYDLLKLHVDNRGKLVDDIEKADTKLTLDMFDKNYIDIVKYMGI